LESESGSKALRTRTIGIIIIALLVAGVGGYAVWTYVVAPQLSPQATKTFYIVTYHWGFAFYDENLNEIPRIVVNKGDRVTLYVIPAEGLGQEFHEEFEERTMMNGVGQMKPGDMQIMEEMEKAEDGGLLDHSVGIIEYSINLVTDHSKFSGKAESPQEFLQTENKANIPTVTFVADKQGSFALICTVDCGYGHAYMVTENGFVVQ